MMEMHINENSTENNKKWSEKGFYFLSEKS